MGEAVAVALTGTFLLAAVGKVAAAHSFTRTLVRLGVGARLRRVLAVTVPAVEFSVAVLLSVAPAHLVTQVAVLALGAGFAGVGVLAMRHRGTVECSCFGTLTSTRLGWAQVALLPLWLAVVAVLRADPPQWGASTGLLVFAVTATAVAWVPALSVVTETRKAGADRRAVGEGMAAPSRGDAAKDLLAEASR